MLELEHAVINSFKVNYRAWWWLVNTCQVGLHFEVASLKDLHCLVSLPPLLPLSLLPSLIFSLPPPFPPSLPFPLYPSLLPSIPPSCPHFFPPSLISFFLVSFLFSLSTGDSVLDSTKRLTHELYLQTQKGSFNFKNVSLNFPSLISWGSSFLYIPKTWTPGSDSLYNTEILYTRHYVQCFVFNTQKTARKSLLCLLGKLKVQRS